ncbi:efflux RND transporter permease subunit [Gammaproteobacteria bacterium]|nr:efflux RND transporter permease subunit [Gammaproteobacteria bacterium]
MNHFTDFFIKKPVYAIVISLLMLFVGLISLFDLETSQYPRIKPSVLSIQFQYDGAGPEEVMRSITEPCEKVLTNIEKLDFIESTTSFGRSTLVLTFFPGYQISNAIPDISAKLSSIRAKLPKSVKEPIYEKVDPTELPSIYFSVASTQMRDQDTYHYYEKKILPHFRNLPGIARIMTLGNMRQAMRIEFDPLALNTYHISLAEAFGFSMQQISDGPSGEVSMHQSYLPMSLSYLTADPHHFERIPITNLPDGPRLGQVAKVFLDKETDKTSSYINHQPGIAIGVIGSTDANPIEVSKTIKQAIKKVKAKIDHHIKLSLIFDTNVSLEESINIIHKTLIETIIMVFLIMFFTLGSVRIVMIPALVIPIALLSTFFFMKWLNFTFNQLTLLALVLSIGMIVDDAIVVAENVFRHIEMGKDRLQAALEGTREIVRPVILITLTLAIIFAPLGILEGSTGKLFQQFGYTIAICVILSGVSALTLSPMMCAYVLPNQLTSNRIADYVTAVMTQITNQYEKKLKATFKYQKLLSFGCLLMSVICLLAYTYIMPKKLVPQEDSGAIFTLIKAPPATNQHFLFEKTKLVGKLMNQTPENEQNATVVGYPMNHTSFIVSVLKHLNDRQRRSYQIINQLRESIAKVPDTEIFQVNPFFTPGSTSFFPVSFVIKSDLSNVQFEQKISQVMALVRKNNNFVFSMNDINPSQSQLKLIINKTIAAQLGISTASINQLLAMAFGNVREKTFVRNADNFYVISAINPNLDINAALDQLSIRAQSGNLIPLSTLVKPTLSATPSVYNHFQGEQSATIDAFIKPFYSKDAAHQYLKKAMQSVFSDKAVADYKGQSRTFNRIQGNSQLLIIYALVFVYACMVLYYENWKDPLVILCTTPLSLLGSLICLACIQGSINIYTNISILTLFALILKHGILMVEFAKSLQQEIKISPLEAISQAATIRFRPIFLTSMSMIIGTLPLMLNTGYGDRCRFEVAVVICGGMMIGTCLTLFIIPSLYSLIHRQ